jgi:transcriptional regulator with XRE-family HTH domain
VPRRRKNAVRDAFMATLHRYGFTFAEIAKGAGISAPRVHQILKGRRASKGILNRR